MNSISDNKNLDFTGSAKTNPYGIIQFPHSLKGGKVGKKGKSRKNRKSKKIKKSRKYRNSRRQ